MLVYGILNQAGFTIISGEIGGGKTTLLRQLLHSIDGQITVGLISNTVMGQGTLLEWILLSLNQPFDHIKYVGLLHSKKITVHIVEEVLGDGDKFGLVPHYPLGPPRLVKQHHPASKK
jgi:hypothetical protein